VDEFGRMPILTDLLEAVSRSFYLTLRVLRQAFVADWIGLSCSRALRTDWRKIPIDPR